MRRPGSPEALPDAAPVSTPPLTSPLVVRVLLACAAVLVAVQAGQFSGLVSAFEKNTIPDFEVFHIVSRLIGSGELDQAYRVATMFPIEQRFSGTDFYLPWTYPPPFDLIVAPLALLPLWLSYLVFAGTTLALYLVVLRRIAGDAFGAVLLALFPTIFVTVGCGQNGFLTGALVGLTCLGLARHDRSQAKWAGIPLGVMVIKPHLAVCLAVYVLASRRWAVAAIAAAVVVGLAALSTLVFGASVWTAFLDGVRESRIFLERGLYPLYRMISIYAALHTLGVPASAAFAIQLGVAAFAVGAVWLATRTLSPRQALGMAALTTVVVSPYAYDYDLPIAGIGLALLTPDLVRLTTKGERFALLCLSWCACGWGMGQTLLVDDGTASSALPADAMPLSLGGLALIVAIVSVFLVLRRHSRPKAALSADLRMAA